MATLTLELDIRSAEGREIIDLAEGKARGISRKLHDALWKLDSARSELRKAQPSTGYRSSAKLGDTTWDIEAAQNKVWAAEVEVLRIMLNLDAA